MRVFCDTNVVAEVIEMRPQAVAMGHILSTVSDELELILSEGGFYTLTYLTERFLKRQSIFNPERVEEQPAMPTCCSPSTSRTSRMWRSVRCKS